MSEADSTSRRRPPTIDLTAKEVEAASSDAGSAAVTPPASGNAAESARESSPAAAPTVETGAAADPGAAGGSTTSPPDTATRPARSSGRAMSYVVGVVAGIVGAAAMAAALWFAGLLPIRDVTSPQAAMVPPVAAPESAASVATSPGTQASISPEISARLDRIEQALQGSPHNDAALAGRVAEAEAQSKALDGSLAALTRRVDEVAAAAQTAATDAKGAASTADAAKNAAQSTTQASVQRSDIDALETRVATLQTTIKALDASLAQRTSSSHADDRAMRLAIAAEALRSSVERGAPFAAELAAVKALGADPNAIARLEPLAAQGLTSAAALGRELTALTPALYRAVEPERSDNSILAKIESQAQKLVRITPVGASGSPVGDDPAAAVARVNDDATRGDIDAALAEIAKLPGPAKALVEAWSTKASARQSALAESRTMAAAAIASLSKSESSKSESPKSESPKSESQ
jgi:hypothetical protein